MPDMSVKIVLVDDHDIVREGLRMIIQAQPDLAVVGEAGDGESCLRLVEEREPDVVVMDIGLGTESGIYFVEKLKERFPDLRVLMLTIHEQREYVRQAMDAGADGFLPKRSTGKELATAIRSVAEGYNYLHPAVTRGVVEDYLEKARSDDPLSDREREVVRLTAMGLTTTEVARELGIAPKTVENHRARASSKLGLKGRVDLVRWAVSHGLVEP